MNPAAAPSLQLRDIHMPADPGLWPPAPGWWLLAALLLAVTAWAGVSIWRRLQVQRRRRQIYRLLDQLERPAADSGLPQFLAQLSALLRRLALTQFPRRQIASLTGEQWLQFLDSSGGDGQFTRGPGQLLASGPYVRTVPADTDTAALVALVRRWIASNTGA